MTSEASRLRMTKILSQTFDYYSTNEPRLDSLELDFLGYSPPRSILQNLDLQFWVTVLHGDSTKVFAWELGLM